MKQELSFMILLASLSLAPSGMLAGGTIDVNGGAKIGAAYAQSPLTERLPAPWSLRQLTGLSNSQQMRIHSICEKHHMESTRLQMEALANKYNLPLPGPGMPRPPRPDAQAAKRAQLGADIMAGLVNAPGSPQIRGASEAASPQLEQARAKMKQLAAQALTNWRSAWHEIEPILTAQQKERLFASQRETPAMP